MDARWEVMLRGQNPDAENERRLELAETAVTELVTLLETYAPVWYSKQQHERAESAMRERGESVPGVFLELLEMLEQYAPVWFTEAHQVKAEGVRKLLKDGTESSGRKPKRRGRGAGG
jgi:hypothetical protein